MKKLTLLFTLLPIFCFSQNQTDRDKIWADSLMQEFKDNIAVNAEYRALMADSIYNIYDELGLNCSKLRAKILLCGAQNELGKSDQAISNLIWVEKNFKDDCDSTIYLKVLANYSYVYLSIDELVRVDSVSNLGLKLWRDEYAEKNTHLVLLNNLSISKAYQGDFESADKYFRELLNNAIIYNEPKYIQRAYINLGNLKGMQGDLDSAYYFIDQASQSALVDSDIANHVVYITTLSSIAETKGNVPEANLLLDSAYSIASSVNNLDLMSTVQYNRALMNARAENYEIAFGFMTEYVDIKEQFLDEERVKSVAEMTEKYETEKKERENQGLKLSNLNSELQNARISKSRNLFVFIGVGVILIALGLWSRLTSIRKSHVAIQKEKDISEGLLLNILPASVAEELKAQGYADAKHFDEATIIFSDFKDFTGHAENMPPSELVNELHVCFKKFDEIITKYGIEKIKTIGDSYMAAGGLPEVESCSVADVILAAFEMQEFVLERIIKNEKEGKPGFEMRIGIHTGPVVAGIVGVKKFQYDIWGDTVNTAARMESSGEVGEVNISESTFGFIKDDPIFQFEFRGRVEAKGKGEMKMYFVRRA